MKHQQFGCEWDVNFTWWDLDDRYPIIINDLSLIYHLYYVGLRCFDDDTIYIKKIIENQPWGYHGKITNKMIWDRFKRMGRCLFHWPGNMFCSAWSINFGESIRKYRSICFYSLMFNLLKLRWNNTPIRCKYKACQRYVDGGASTWMGHGIC